MRILVLCPMEVEYKNFKKALPLTPKNDYKVVCCGVGKASSAATTALELNAAEYELIAVIGYAAGHGFNLGDFIIPDRARYHDAHVPEDLVPELVKEYPLEGADPYPILTGDSFITKDNYKSILDLYPRTRVLFDMEATSVCQVAEDLAPDTNVMVLKLISDIPSQNTCFVDFVNTHSDFSQFVLYLENLDNV